LNIKPNGRDPCPEVNMTFVIDTDWKKRRKLRGRTHARTYKRSERQITLRSFGAI